MKSSSFCHIRVSDNCLIHFVSELAKYIHLDKTTTSFIIDVSCIVYLQPILTKQHFNVSNLLRV